MIFRYIRDLKKNGRSTIQIAVSIILLVGWVSLIYIVGIGYLVPWASDRIDQASDVAFGNYSDAIVIGGSILGIIAMLAFGIKVDGKNARDPASARYMPSWVLWLLGKTKGEIKDVKSDDGFERLNLQHQLVQLTKEYQNFISANEMAPHKHIVIGDDFFYVRGDIHRYAQALSKLEVQIDTNLIVECDRKLQKWAKDKNRVELICDEEERNERPKNEWWYWIDRLGELTSEQRNTV